jgi:hypothetical protein
MKKITHLIPLFLLILLLPLYQAIAAGWTNIQGYTPQGYERRTVTAVAVSQLDTTLIETSGAVFITVETNDIRYRIDGGNPSAINGHLVDSATMQNVWLYDVYSIKNFRAIAVGGNSVLHITYYRRN